MSRRRVTSVRRGHRGAGRAGAAFGFVILMVLLGAVANAASIPRGLVGFAALVIAILCWVGAGSGRSRGRW